MEENRIDSAASSVRQYIEAKWNLFLLNTSDKAATTVSSIASILLMTICILFVLFFVSVGVALMIGRAVDNSSVGFLIVGLFYLILSAVLYFARNTLIKIPVVNKLLHAFHADYED